MSRRRPRLPARSRPPMTRAQKVGTVSVLTLVAVAAVGVVAGLLLDRLIDFDEALDTGGEWDEGGGIHTPWF